MNDIVLVELVIPVLEESYDVFVPVNKKIGDIINLISKLSVGLSGGYFVVSDTNCLYSGDTGEAYPIDTLLINTDIRNGSKLILM